MKLWKKSQSSVVKFVVLMFLVVLIQGCGFKYLPDYDAKVFDETIKVSKKVDMFYGLLIETNEKGRMYEDFKQQYIDIEVDIRSLLIQNESRHLNDESISINETILEKWLKYKEQHKVKNSYKDVLAKNHRKRFTRLFTAMSVSELSKDLKKELIKEKEE